MSLAGDGAVAIWHDIEPAGREQFYAWHGQEHMPERVGIPGFLRGRRYVARNAGLEFFNLYEAQSHAAVTGPDYRRRLDSPTPWTVETVKHFRRVARSICRVAFSVGPGQGALVATWRYDVPPEAADDHIERLSGSLLPEIAGNFMIAGAHLLVADADASAVGNAESRARGMENQVPRWIVLVEGWGDEDAFATLCAGILTDPVLTAAGAAGPAERGLYVLQATVDRGDVAAAG